MVLPVWAVLPSLPRFSDILPDLLDRGIFQCPILCLSLLLLLYVYVYTWGCAACYHTHVVVRGSPLPFMCTRGMKAYLIW